MFIIYNFFLSLVIFISPLIILIRIFLGKEDQNRFKEKYGFLAKNNNNNEIVWIHGASVGEILSIIPIIKKFEEDKKIKRILITSSTTSSSLILSKFKFKKIVHQFFPIDSNFLSKKFLNYWKPSSVFFIDSEIWPNMYLNLKERQISITLLNGRITKKSFLRWKKTLGFSKKIFSLFDQCFSSNKETIKFLKQLGAKKIRFIGNLKFAQSENEKVILSKNIKKFIFSKKTWCASSTHDTEEIFCETIFLKKCTSSSNGIFYYYDNDHLTRDGARLVVDEILTKWDQE